MQEISDDFRFKVLHVALLKPQRKREDRGLGDSPPMKCIIVEV